MANKAKFIAIIGMLALIFGAYLGALGLVAYYDKKEHEKRGEPPRFDERQRIVRLRAGNHALCALVAYLVLWTILNQIGYAWAQNVWTMLFCALFLVWGVWASDCILHDGFIGWKEQKNVPDSFALTYTVMLLMPVNNFHSAGITDSRLPIIFVLADIAVLCAVVLYKKRKEIHAEGEEDAL